MSTVSYETCRDQFTLDCINCFVSGSFAVTGHISVDHFNLKDLTLKGSPQSLQAALQLEATIASTVEVESLEYTKELFSFPIPDAGLEIEGILRLGATLSYDVGYSSSFSGSATIDFGLQAGVPDSAQIIADIQDPESSSATGWSGAFVTPIFDIKKESASVELSAFAQPKLAFGIELIEIGTFDVALTVKLPEISVTLTAAYDEDGVCGAGSSRTGIKLDSEVNIEVDLQIDAALGDGNDTSEPSWSHTLYAYPIPLGSLCFPLAIPGLDSSSSVQGTASYSTSTSQPLVFGTETSTSGAASAIENVSGVTETPSASTVSNGLDLSTGLVRSTGTSVSGLSSTASNAKSRQSTGATPALTDQIQALNDDLRLSLASTTATMTPLTSIKPFMTDTSTDFAPGFKPDLGLPSAQAKTVIMHSHTSLMPPSSPDTLSNPGQLDGAVRFEVQTPTKALTSSVQPTVTSISSKTVAIGNGDMGEALVQSHFSSMPSASANTLSSPTLADSDDRSATFKAEATKRSRSPTVLSSTPSTPAVSSGDKKDAAVKPKPTIPSTREESFRVHKPMETSPTRPQNLDPVVEDNIEDFPPMPNVILPPPGVKKPSPMAPTTTSKPIPVATLTALASEGGGCRMVKRSGKRMLIC